MPELHNQRWERFAQFIASGETLVDAHEKAGYERHDGNAATLAKHERVMARLAELRGKVAEDTAITLGSLVGRADTLYAKAIELGQVSAAVAALKELGVLSGKRIERRETGAPGEFALLERMSAEELEKFALGEIELEAFQAKGEAN